MAKPIFLTKKNKPTPPPAERTSCCITGSRYLRNLILQVAVLWDENKLTSIGLTITQSSSS